MFTGLGFLRIEGLGTGVSRIEGLGRRDVGFVSRDETDAAPRLR